jgi:aryl-alcohol dehydrogenase-like predicted oxidoreductase
MDPMSCPRISRIGIGTVQFGFEYGINNKTGQVGYPSVLKILEIAHKKGINFLDTSRLYGTSETVLGNAFRDLGVEFTVSTKLDLPPNYRELPDDKIVELSKTSLRQSLEALGLDQAPIYLLHNYDYKTFRHGLIWNCVLEDMIKGLIEYPGISIGGGPSQAEACLEDANIKALQIPFNVFDQRWERSDIFNRCIDKGVLLFNRSTYLQGLLLMDTEVAAEKVPVSQEFKMRFSEIADIHRISPKELALRYVLGKENLSSTIIGLDSPEQLEENIALFDKGPLDDGLEALIETAFQDPPDTLVNPALWNIPYPGRTK